MVGWGKQTDRQVKVASCGKDGAGESPRGEGWGPTPPWETAACPGGCGLTRGLREESSCLCWEGGGQAEGRVLGGAQPRTEEVGGWDGGRLPGAALPWRRAGREDPRGPLRLVQKLSFSYRAGRV